VKWCARWGEELDMMRAGETQSLSNKRDATIMHGGHEREPINGVCHCVI
jgi:hypothetical protein